MDDRTHNDHAHRTYTLDELLDELAVQAGETGYDERPEEVEMNTEPTTTEMSPEELADARRKAWGGLGCLLILAAFIVPPVLFVVFALLYALFGR